MAAPRAGNESQRLSWVAQAFLWPAGSSLLTITALGVFFFARDGLKYSPGIWGTIAWIVFFVPIIVVVCTMVLGGVAAGVALLVRGTVAVVVPRAPRALRVVVLAAVTGACEAFLVVGVFALMRSSWEVPTVVYGYAAAVGAVAVIASSAYARDLFSDRTQE